MFAEEHSVTIENTVKAIAAFERTLITPNSPYDRYVGGNESAMTKQQVRVKAKVSDPLTSIADYRRLMKNASPQFRSITYGVHFNWAVNARRCCCEPLSRFWYTLRISD